MNINNGDVTLESNHRHGMAAGVLTAPPAASHLIAILCIRCYGCVLHLSPEHPTQALLKCDAAVVGWRRPHGRPHSRWMDVVKEDGGYGTPHLLNKCYLSAGTASFISSHSTWLCVHVLYDQLLLHI